MNHLFIIRHASYGPGPRINPQGVHQLKILGKEIQEIVKNDSVLILASTAPRALDSANTLAPFFKNKIIEPIEYLWSGPDSPNNMLPNHPHPKNLWNIIEERKNKADALLMVSHMEVCDLFPSYFFEKEFARKESIESLPRGKAVWFDLQKQAFAYLPRH